MSPDLNNSGPDSKPASMLGAWIAIGAGLGVALGVVFDSIALGIAMGVSIGVAIGASVDRSRKTEGEQISGGGQRLLYVGLGLGLLVGLVVLVAFLLLKAS